MLKAELLVITKQSDSKLKIYDVYKLKQTHRDPGHIRHKKRKEKKNTQ